MCVFLQVIVVYSHVCIPTGSSSSIAMCESMCVFTGNSSI